MSWDAVMLKINGPFRPIEEVADEDYLPLGSLESVAERIRAVFPNAEWSSPTWALDYDTGVTIDLEGVESSNSILVSVSGSENPIPHLLALARANDWVVLDCSTTEFLNPDEVSSEGWEGYQSLMGSLPEPIPGSGDQAPPPTAPQTAPLTPPRTRKKKKAAKKVERKVKRQTAAKKVQPKKTRSKKKSPKKKSPKKKHAKKKNLKKKRPKKKK